MKWFREDRQRPHHRLDAWRYGRDFELAVYKVTRHFPMEERYGLTSQMRRAAVSIPSNIAEGAARKTSKDFPRFLYHARGSLEEVDMQLEIASELNMLSSHIIKLLQNTFDLLNHIFTSLIRAIQQKTDGRP